MSRYRVGIVGFGWVAGAHLKSFADLDQFEPVAVMSRRELDPEMIRQEYGVSVKVYNDYDKFLSDGDIDIVDICTPHPYHPAQTIKAAEAGKDLVIEKPIALDFESAVAMLEAVEKAGVRTSVCFEARFISVARSMKSMIGQGLIGDPYYAECGLFSRYRSLVRPVRMEYQEGHGGQQPAHGRMPFAGYDALPSGPEG